MNRALSAIGNKFSFTLANGTGAAKAVAILPAYYDTITLTEGTPNTITYKNGTAIAAAGFTCDYVIDDGVLDATSNDLVCTAANSKFKVKHFKDYVKAQGLVCKKIVIQANNADVFTKIIEVVKVTPLTGAASQYIDLSTFYSPDQYSSTKIEINNVDIEFAFDTLMLFTIDDGRTVTFTFQF